MPNAFDHNDGFEEFLREATDSFSMTPHTRVWKSLYNNIHPQKKWPAISTKIILFFCFIFFQAEHRIQKNIVVDNNVPSSIIQVKKTKRFKKSLQENNIVNKQNLIAQSSNTSPKNDEVSEVLSANKKFDATIYSAVIMAAQNQHAKRISEIESNQLIPNKKLSIRFLNDKDLFTTSNKNEVGMNLMKKTASSYSLQFYATPGVGYLYNSHKNAVLGSDPLSLESSIGTGDKKAFSTTTLNLEAGGAVTMNVSKMFRLKAGMQLNFTRFEDSENESNVFASTDQQTSLISKTDMFQKENNPRINPDLYQLSLPIGTEVKIIGNEKIQWIAGATIQPSFLMNNTDNNANNETTVNKNEPYALRRWNVNSSIETYLSYQIQPNVIINVGPQLRYQWLSTFNREIPKGIDKLYNFGLKFGISRNF